MVFFGSITVSFSPTPIPCSSTELYRTLQNSTNIHLMIDSLFHRLAVVREKECTTARHNAVYSGGF